MLIFVDASYVDSAEWVWQYSSLRKSRIAKVEMDNKDGND